jgi:putative redox protein
MKAAVQWKENMTFIGTPDSGFSVQMDADSDFGGTNQGVRPMEMVALGLAGCTGMDVISILRKKRQQVTHFEVRVNAPRSGDHPKVFTSARITYLVTGTSVDEAAVLRSIELSMTKYCPVQVMLSQAFPMELYYEIYEDEQDGTPRLVSQGIWEEFSTL